MLVQCSKDTLFNNPHRLHYCHLRHCNSSSNRRCYCRLIEATAHVSSNVSWVSNLENLNKCILSPPTHPFHSMALLVSIKRSSATIFFCLSRTFLLAKWLLVQLCISHKVHPRGLCIELSACYSYMGMGFLCPETVLVALIDMLL